MHILVTGTKGQLAQCLKQTALERDHKAIKITCLGRPEFDLSDSDTARLVLSKALELHRPDLIIHAAAYTAVDRAEAEVPLAMQVNAQGSAIIAEVSSKLCLPMMMISTDYVFSGHCTRPYRETDTTNPLNIYGQSKLAGELAVMAVMAENPHHLILRTGWLYSAYGQNFVKTILGLAQTRDEISVICDQFGNPTSAHDLAQALLHCAPAFINQRKFSGIYHLSGSGIASRSEFAREIMRISQLYGGPIAHIKEIATKDYPTAAIRPANSALDCEKFNTHFGWQMPHWQKSLDDILHQQ